jgi:hypothetical protein
LTASMERPRIAIFSPRPEEPAAQHLTLGVVTLAAIVILFVAGCIRPPSVDCPVWVGSLFRLKIDRLHRINAKSVMPKPFYVF